MGYVVYSKHYGRAIALCETERAAKARVTRNNKQYTFELLTGTSNMEEYAYCSWADFEEIARSKKRKGHISYHEF